MSKAKELAMIIVGKRKQAPPPAPVDDADDMPDDAMVAVAEDMLSAIESKDANALAMALTALCEMK